MADMQEARPGGPGTAEGETGPTGADPVAPGAYEGPEENTRS